MHVHKKHIHITQPSIDPNKSYKREWFARHEVITIAFDKSTWIPCLRDQDLSWNVHHLQHKLKNSAIDIIACSCACIQSSRIPNILDYLLLPFCPSQSPAASVIKATWPRSIYCICPVCRGYNSIHPYDSHVKHDAHYGSISSRTLFSKQWNFTPCGASLREDRWSWEKKWGQPPSSLSFLIRIQIGEWARRLLHITDSGYSVRFISFGDIAIVS